MCKILSPHLNEGVFWNTCALLLEAHLSWKILPPEAIYYPCNGCYSVEYVAY